MRKTLGAFLLCTSLLFCSSAVMAVPLDLSGFTAEPGVIESGGTVTFEEDFSNIAWFFENNDFLVPGDATILSFNYDFSFGDDNYDDYLTFEVDFSTKLDVVADITGGYFEYDLTALQGSRIDLAWGLIWGGDEFAGTTASIYNIDLAAAPVPEPATIILLGGGLLGLLGIGRKKILNQS